jgi:hypothetical protein
MLLHAIACCIQMTWGSGDCAVGESSKHLLMPRSRSTDTYSNSSVNVIIFASLIRPLSYRYCCLGTQESILHSFQMRSRYFLGMVQMSKYQKSTLTLYGASLARRVDYLNDPFVDLAVCDLAHTSIPMTDQHLRTLL